MVIVVDQERVLCAIRTFLRRPNAHTEPSFIRDSCEFPTKSRLNPISPPFVILTATRTRLLFDRNDLTNKEIHLSTARQHQKKLNDKTTMDNEDIACVMYMRKNKSDFCGTF